MKELQAWLNRRARHDQRIPSLDDVLIRGTFASYAWYRLRLFGVRYLAASVVHIVRVSLLSAAFSHSAFLQLLLAEAAVAFVSSFWWGALESMREQVRRLHRQGRPHLVPREIGRWLTLGWILAGCVMTACMAWLAMRRGMFGPFELYAVALFVRLALQFVTRVFHSGAYALRRIYRPPWAIIGIELTMFGAVVLAWPIAGAWALPIGSLVSTLIGAALTIHFTRRLYAFLGLTPPWIATSGARLPLPVTWRELLAAGLSFAVMKLDAVLVFGLFHRTTVELSEVELFVLLFVMSPTIQAGFDWAQLFYFDLKRLEDRSVALWREQYCRHVNQLAWIVGLSFWLLGSFTGTIVYLRSLEGLYWLLCPFFVTRSLLASAQIQAFCARRYMALLGTGALWLIGFAFATQVESDVGKLAIVTATTAVIYLLIARISAQAVAEDDCVGLVEWVRQLAAVSEPVAVRSAQLANPERRGRANAGKSARWAHRHFGRTIAARLRQHGTATIVPPDRVLWFELASAPRIRPESIAAISGGMARPICDTGVHPNGRAALSVVCRELELMTIDSMVTESAGHVSLAELEAQFGRLFPEGWILRPGTVANVPAGVPASWRRRILREARGYLADLGSSRSGFPLDVTALSVAGRLRLVFVVARNARPGTRRRWREAIRQANIRVALGAVAD